MQLHIDLHCHLYECVCRQHIHSNYNRGSMLRRYVMAPCLQIHDCIACTYPLRGHMFPHFTVFTCNYMNMQKRAFGSIRSTELSSREDCCQRGLAKITIKLSQPESRTPS